MANFRSLEQEANNQAYNQLDNTDMNQPIIEGADSPDDSSKYATPELDKLLQLYQDYGKHNQPANVANPDNIIHGLTGDPGYERTDLDVNRYKNILNSISPDSDIEDVAALNQSVGQKWDYGIQKFIGKTGIATVGGLAGFIYGIPSIFTKGGFEGLWDNEMQDYLNKMTEELDSYLPTFYRQKENDYNLLQKMGTANFWSNDLTGALSFTAGAITTELIASALTTVTFGAAAPAQIAATGRYIGLLTNMLRNGKKITDLGKMAKAVKAAGNLSMTGGIAQVGRSFLMGSVYEATVEANSYKDQMMNMLKVEYSNAHPNEEIPKELLAEWEDSINDAGNAVFAANLAIVGSSNMMSFGRIFSRGIKGAQDDMARLAYKEGKASISNLIPGKAGKVIDYAYTALKRPLTEGVFEEGLQGVVQQSAIDYVRRKYDPTSTYAAHSILESIGEGFVEQFTSKRGAIDIGMGALIGSMGFVNPFAFGTIKDADGKTKFGRKKDTPLFIGGIMGAFSERSAENKKAKDKADTVNKITYKDLFKYLSDNKDMIPSTEEGLGHLIRSISLQETQDTLNAELDLFNSKNVEDDILHSFISARAAAGLASQTVEDFKDVVENMSNNDFATQFGYSNMDDKQLNERKRSVIDGFTKRVESVEKATKAVDNVLRLDYSKKSNRDVREAFVYLLAKADAIESRMKKISKELSDIGEVSINDSTFDKDKASILEGFKDNPRIKEATELLDDYHRLLKVRKQALNLYRTMLTPNGVKEFGKKIDESVDKSIKEFTNPVSNVDEDGVTTVDDKGKSRLAKVHFKEGNTEYVVKRVAGNDIALFKIVDDEVTEELYSTIKTLDDITKAIKEGKGDIVYLVDGSDSEIPASADAGSRMAILAKINSMNNIYDLIDYYENDISKLNLEADERIKATILSRASKLAGLHFVSYKELLKRTAKYTRKNDKTKSIVVVKSINNEEYNKKHAKDKNFKPKDIYFVKLDEDGNKVNRPIDAKELKDNYTIDVTSYSLTKEIENANSIFELRRLKAVIDSHIPANHMYRTQLQNGIIKLHAYKLALLSDQLLKESEFVANKIKSEEADVKAINNELKEIRKSIRKYKADLASINEKSEYFKQKEEDEGGLDTDDIKTLNSLNKKHSRLTKLISNLNNQLNLNKSKLVLLDHNISDLKALYKTVLTFGDETNPDYKEYTGLSAAYGYYINKLKNNPNVETVINIGIDELIASKKNVTDVISEINTIIKDVNESIDVVSGYIKQYSIINMFNSTNDDTFVKALTEFIDDNTGNPNIIALAKQLLSDKSYRDEYRENKSKLKLLKTDLVKLTVKLNESTSKFELVKLAEAIKPVLARLDLIESLAEELYKKATETKKEAAANTATEAAQSGTSSGSSGTDSDIDNSGDNSGIDPSGDDIQGGDDSGDNGNINEAIKEFDDLRRKRSIRTFRDGLTAGSEGNKNPSHPRYNSNIRYRNFINNNNILKSSTGHSYFVRVMTMEAFNKVYNTKEFGVPDLENQIETETKLRNEYIERLGGLNAWNKLPADVRAKYELEIIDGSRSIVSVVYTLKNGVEVPVNERGEEISINDVPSKGVYTFVSSTKRFYNGNYGSKTYEQNAGLIEKASQELLAFRREILALAKEDLPSTRRAINGITLGIPILNEVKDAATGQTVVVESDPGMLLNNTFGIFSPGTTANDIDLKVTTSTGLPLYNDSIPAPKGRVYAINTRDGRVYRLQRRRLGKQDVAIIEAAFKYFVDNSKIKKDEKGNSVMDSKGASAIGDTNIFKIIENIVYWTGTKDDNKNPNTLFKFDSWGKNSSGVTAPRIIMGSDANGTPIVVNLTAVSNGKLVLSPEFIARLAEFIPTLRHNVRTIVNDERGIGQYYNWTLDKNGKLTTEAVPYSSYKNFLLEKILVSNQKPYKDNNGIQFKEKILLIDTSSGMSETPVVDVPKAVDTVTTNTAGTSITKRESLVNNTSYIVTLKNINGTILGQGVLLFKNNKFEFQSAKVGITQILPGIPPSIANNLNIAYSNTTNFPDFLPSFNTFLTSVAGADTTIIASTELNILLETTGSEDAFNPAANAEQKVDQAKDNNENLGSVETEEGSNLTFRKKLETDIVNSSGANALEEVREILNTVPIKILDVVANNAAWGALSNGVILLADTNTLGTGYHEAYHAISILFLSPRERNRIYNEYRRLNKAYHLSDIEVEEALAEDFRRFMLNDGIEYINEPARRTWFTQLIDLIRKLWSIITDKDYTPRKANRINDIFNKARNGEFRNKTPNYSGEGLTFLSSKILPNQSIAFTDDVNKGITNLFFSNLRMLGGVKMLFDNGKVSGKTLTLIYDRILNPYITDPTDPTKKVLKYNDTRGKSINEQITVLTNHYKLATESYKKTGDKKTGDLIGRLQNYINSLYYIRDNYYVARGLNGMESRERSVQGIHNKYLENYGLEIDVLNEDSIDTYSDELSRDVRDIAQNWSYDSMKISVQKSASVMTKLIVGMLPDYQFELDNDGRPIVNPNTGRVKTTSRVNSAGLQGIMDFGYVFKVLINKLNDTHSIEDIKTKLYELRSKLPPITELIEELGLHKENLSLSDFDTISTLVGFVQTFSKHKNSYKLMQLGESGNTIFEDANSNRFNTRTIERWYSNLYNSSNVEANIDETGLGGFVYNESFIKSLPETDSNEYKQMGIVDAMRHLQSMGIVFSSIDYNKLTATRISDKITDQNDRTKIVQAALFFIKSIKSGLNRNTLDDRYNIEGSKGTLDKLCAIEENLTIDHIENSFENLNGDRVFLVTLYNYITKTVSLINDPKFDTIDKLMAELPFLRSAYARRSLWLSKVFDPTTGRRISDAKLDYHIMTGGITITGKEGRREPFEKLNISDKLVMMLNGTLQGINVRLRASDNKLEGMFDTGSPLFSLSDIENNIFDNALKQYLEDEILFGREIGSKNYKFSKEVSSRGILLDLLPDDVKSKFSNIQSSELNKYINDNWDTLIKPHFTKFIDKSVKTLLSMVEEYRLVKKTNEGIYVNNSVHAPIDKSTTGKSEEVLTETQLKSKLRVFMANYIASTVEQTKLFIGHPLFYNGIDNFFKRMSAPSGTGKFPITDSSLIQALDNHMSNSGYRVKYFENKPVIKTQVYKEHTVFSSYAENYQDFIVSKLMANGMTEQQAVEESISIINPYTDISEADGEAMMTLDSYRFMLMTIGNWSFGKEIAYLLEKGFTNYPNTDFYGRYAGKKINPESATILGVQKFQHFGPLADDTFVPSHYKLSIYPILPSLLKAKSNSNLVKLHEKMVNGSIDIVTYDSSVKVGVATNPDGSVEEIYKDGLLNINYGVTQNTFLSNWKIQLDAAEKAKSHIGGGTQAGKHIVNMTYENGQPLPMVFENRIYNTVTEEYYYPEERFTSSDVNEAKTITANKVKEYNNLVSRRISIGLAELTEKLGLSRSDGKYIVSDKNKLIELLLNEAEKKNVAVNIIESIELFRKQSETVDIDKIVNSQAFERVLVSMVDSFTLSQKRLGTMAIEISPTLLEDYNNSDDNSAKLKVETVSLRKVVDGKVVKVEKQQLVSNFLKPYRIENGVIKPMQIMLPAYFKKLGKNIDISSIKDKSLLEAIGYRIPTAGLNAIESIEIVGFLPDSFGDSVVIPAELVTKSGTDFDVDKLNIILNNFYYNSDNQPKRIRYNDYAEQYKDYVNAEGARVVESIVKDLLKRYRASNKFKTVTYFGKYEELINNTITDYSKFHDVYNIVLNEVNNDIIEIEASIRSNPNSSETEFRQMLLETLDSFSHDVSKLAANDDNKLMSEMYFEKMAIENRMNELFRDFIHSPNNFEQLITATSSVDIKDASEYALYLSAKANNFKGKFAEFKVSRKKEIKSMPLYNLIDPKFNLYMSVRLMVAKMLVGISALQATNDVLAQQIGYTLSDTFNYTKFNGEIAKYSTSINIEGVSDNKTLGHHNTVINNYDTESFKIPMLIGQIISAVVDAVKDPFIIDAGITTETLPVYLMLIRRGVGPKTATMFLKQPIIQDYYNNISRYRSLHSVANGIDMNVGKIMKLTKQNYTKTKIDDNSSDIIKVKDLASMLSTPKELFTSEQKILQVKIFNDFIRYTRLARKIGEHIQATTYDTKGINDTISNVMVILDLTNEMSNNETGKRVIENFDTTFANDSYLSGFKNTTDEAMNIFKSLSSIYSNNHFRENMIRLIRMLTSDSNPTVTNDQLISATNKFKAHVLTHVMLYYNSVYNGKLENPLVTQRTRLAAGNNSVPKRIARIQGDTTHPLNNNDLIRAFVPFIRPNKFDNLKVVDQRLDKLHSSKLSEAWKQIFSMDENLGIDLIKFAIIQSGFESSLISFTNIVPAEIYNNMVKSSLEFISKYDYNSNDSITNNVMYAALHDFILSNPNSRILIPTSRDEEDVIASIFPYYKNLIPNSEYAAFVAKYGTDKAKRKKGLPENRTDRYAIYRNYAYEYSIPVPEYLGGRVAQAAVNDTSNNLQIMGSGKHDNIDGIMSDLQAPTQKNDQLSIPVVEDVKSSSTGNPTLNTGGALRKTSDKKLQRKSSDIVFEEEALKYGHTVNAYSFTGHKHGSKYPNVISDPLLWNEAEVEKEKARKILGREKASDDYINNLLKRNWFQVKYSDAIFAVGTLVNNKTVSGGTGYAVQMAINYNKPVNIFDQKSNSWYKYDYKLAKFVEQGTPKLTTNYAGIGTRELEDNGVEAIKNLFKFSFGEPSDNKSINTNTKKPFDIDEAKLDVIRQIQDGLFDRVIIEQRLNKQDILSKLSKVKTVEELAKITEKICKVV